AGESAAKAYQQLTQPCFLDREVEPDDFEGRRLGAKNGGGTERSDHFVVAHVDDPKVAVETGAIAGDGQDDVRVDGRDAQVDDLKMGFGVTRGQQGLQVTARAIGRFRIAHRGGLAQDEYAAGVDGFCGRHAN